MCGLVEFMYLVKLVIHKDQQFYIQNGYGQARRVGQTDRIKDFF